MKRRLLTILALLTCASVAAETTLIDPTQPNGNSKLQATAGNPAAASWRLTATQISPRTRGAIINGSHVTEGGLIGSARVLRISHGQVKLDTQGETITLRLVQSEVKKTR